MIEVKTMSCVFYELHQFTDGEGGDTVGCHQCSGVLACGSPGVQRLAGVGQPSVICLDVTRM